MARITLKDSGVVFDKANHTYELNGKMLQGITTMLQRQLFSTEYEGIPWAIVKKAGEYGSKVHDSCEDFDKNWNNDGTQEVQDYISICKEYGFTHEASVWVRRILQKPHCWRSMKNITGKSSVSLQDRIRPKTAVTL